MPSPSIRKAAFWDFFVRRKRELCEINWILQKQTLETIEF